MDENQTIDLDRVQKINIEEEMKKSYIDYSMSVIVARALPDVRDGFKPVHRRILYGMLGIGNTSSNPYKKCARVVGEVLGKYHPHGDSSVYGALVRMGQSWNMRYMLVDGQGNFGSVDGDSPAAMRYTECRLSKMGEHIMDDLEKDTVDMDSNFDDTLTEPSVMPTKIPNLLVNGGNGIAVGMATNMPTHNLCEVIDGCCAYIDNPDIDTDGLMQYIQAPDFPTGAYIYGLQGVRQAYETGRGRIVMRAKSEIESGDTHDKIVVTEIPYGVNKADLVAGIADLVKEGKITGISNVNDESGRQGMRIVVDVKRDANANVILNKLYKMTAMQSSFSVNSIALVNGRPRLLTLKECVKYFVEHRHDVTIRRTKYDLKKAQERAHILEGLIIACDNIDEVVRIIRASKTPSDAQRNLEKRFDLDELQSKAIVDMRLSQLTGLRIDQLHAEFEELERQIAYFEQILSDPELCKKVMKDDLQEVKEKYGDERRTEIAHVSGEVDIEDLIPVEECVFTLTHAGYIKRQSKDTYQVQKRGGRGISGLSHKDEDFVEELFIGSTHDYVLFVTDQGRVYRLKGYQIYEGSRTSKGTNIVNLLPLQNEESVIRMLCMPADKAEGFLTIVTKRGLIKRTPIEAYSNIRKSGLLAVSLYEGDSLAWCRITSGSDELLLATKDGMSIRFDERGARQMGRMGHGVRAVRLAEGDEVVGVGILRPGATVFTVTENGKGRRSRVDDYRIQSRGGKGIRNYAKGGVAGIKILDEEDDVILISQEGIIIRMHAEDINVQSRYGSGVRVMRLAEGDRVVTVARTERSDEEPVEKPEDEPEETLTDEELAALAAEDAAADEEPADDEGDEE